MLEITINRDDCIGSGSCCYCSPSVFALDVTGYAIVTDPNGDTEENIVRCARNCPTKAISVFRDGEQLA